MSRTRRTDPKAQAPRPIRNRTRAIGPGSCRIRSDFPQEIPFRRPGPSERSERGPARRAPLDPPGAEAKPRPTGSASPRSRSSLRSSLNTYIDLSATDGQDTPSRTVTQPLHSTAGPGPAPRRRRPGTPPSNRGCERGTYLYRPSRCKQPRVARARRWGPRASCARGAPSGQSGATARPPRVHACTGDACTRSPPVRVYATQAHHGRTHGRTRPVAPHGHGHTRRASRARSPRGHGPDRGR